MRYPTLWITGAGKCLIFSTFSDTSYLGKIRQNEEKVNEKCSRNTQDCSSQNRQKTLGISQISEQRSLEQLISAPPLRADLPHLPCRHQFRQFALHHLLAVLREIRGNISYSQHSTQLKDVHDPLRPLRTVSIRAYIAGTYRSARRARDRWCPFMSRECRCGGWNELLVRDSELLRQCRALRDDHETPELIQSLCDRIRVLDRDVPRDRQEPGE